MWDQRQIKIGLSLLFDRSRKERKKGRERESEDEREGDHDLIRLEKEAKRGWKAFFLAP